MLLQLFDSSSPVSRRLWCISLFLWFLVSLCVLKDSCVSALFDKAFPSAARFRAKGMCISGVGFGLFSLSKTASARCVLNVPLLPQDFL